MYFFKFYVLVLVNLFKLLVKITGKLGTLTKKSMHRNIQFSPVRPIGETNINIF